MLKAAIYLLIGGIVLVRYLQSIRFICLAMSDEYIDSHFEEIKSHASDIETRLDDSYCTAEQMKQDNHQVIDG